MPTAQPSRSLEQEYRIVPINEIQPHPKNARIGKESVIRESIRANGWYGAVLVQRSTNYIVAGSHRWKAAIDEGLESIPALIVDVTDRQAKRIMVIDNRASDLGGDNREMLASLLEEFRIDGTLAGTGFTDDQTDRLINDLLTEPPDPNAGMGGFEEETVAFKIKVTKEEKKQLEAAKATMGERALAVMLVERAIGATK